MPRKKSASENQRKSILSFLNIASEDMPLSLDFKGSREMLSSLASWAGKGKDEMVQLICREIGFATANVLKEPITQLLHNKKLQLTLELVPKDAEKVEHEPKKKTKSSKTSRKKKTTSR